MPSRRPRPRRPIVAVVLVAALAALAVVPASALAAVTVSRAEVSSGTLRLEGRALANRSITVDGVAMGTSDGAGAFRISRSSYRPPADCTVDVNDGSATPAVARLSGCTVSSTSPTPTPTPAPATTTITPNVAGFDANVGTPFQETFVLTGTSITSPSSFRIVSGALPAGLALTPIPITSPRPFPQNAIRIQGTPTTIQNSTFTLRGTDARGLTATRTYTIRVAAPRPLTIAPQAWGPLVVGAPQNLFLDGDGGVKPYRWSISAGALPPGMAVIQDSATVGLVRVGGTPTQSGSFTWTLRLTDARSATLDRTFTTVVGAATLPPLVEVAVTPSTTGPSTVIATVRLLSPVPSGSATVSLSSSDPAVASVPSTVTVAAGDTIAAFPVTTSAVTQSTATTISATLGGVTKTTPLTVNPG